MFIRVIAARATGGHRVWLRFNDELEGEIDLLEDLHGEVFEPLKDPELFRNFAVDYTLEWPNGADFAPEFLHDRLQTALDRRKAR